jgi:UDP:flavonoid glycosyltransferase YjiC (YdhE family)
VGLKKNAFGKKPETEDLFLVSCPEWFAMPQKDWPASSRVTGFLYFDGGHRDSELEAFIEAHGPPIVFTPGTGVSDVRFFFELASGISRKLAIPAIFISPALARMEPPDRILIRDYAELHWLLPRSKMLVHHGGIGTVAQAIRAGVPQVIIPGRFDQPDNALRVALLGLGGAVFSQNPTAGEIADFIRKVLASPAVEKQVRTGAMLVHAHASRDLAYQMIRRVLDVHFGLPEDAGRQAVH